MQDRWGDRAKRVRAEVDRLGGRLTLSASALALLFAVRAFENDDASAIERALGQEGVRVEGRLPQKRPDDEVTLTTEGQEAEQEPPVEPAGPASTAPPPAEVIAAQAASLPAAALAAGVLVPGLLASALGFGAWWGYGLLFLALTGGLWLLVGRSFSYLARIFLFPFRSLAWSAFLLGALPALIAILVVSALVVAPVSAKRSSDAREQQALGLIAEAREANRLGDPDEAIRLVAEARDKDSDVEGWREVSAAADGLRAEQATERDRRAAYRDGRRLLREGDYVAALRVFDELGDYRDSPGLAAGARHRGARHLLREARLALANGDFDLASSKARESRALRPSSAATTLLSDVRSALTAARARARERRQAREETRRLEQEQRQLEQEQRRLEQEQQLEEDLYTPPDGGASCPDGTPFPQFPGQRDGDGDGCYGET